MMNRLNLNLVGAVLLLLTVAGCATSGVDRSGRVGVLDEEITESSGLIRSSLNSELYWTLNDSGNEPVLYAVDLSGRIHGRARIAGVRNIDWEALTIDGEGKLYIGEIGNNENNRRDLVIYVIKEPEPDVDQTVEVERSIPFHFPDQKAFPDAERMNFDAEAIFFHDGFLYVLSKHRSDTMTGLYRLDPATSDVTKIDEIEIGSMVTDAAISVRGRLAVLTYRGIHFFDVSEGVSLEGTEVYSLEFVPEVSKQSEGIAWGGDSIVFTNEQRDVHLIDRPLQRRPGRYPQR